MVLEEGLDISSLPETLKEDFKPAGPARGSVQGDQLPHGSLQLGRLESRERSAMWLLQFQREGGEDGEDRGAGQADNDLV